MIRQMKKLRGVSTAVKHIPHAAKDPFFLLFLPEMTENYINSEVK